MKNKELKNRGVISVLTAVIITFATVIAVMSAGAYYLGVFDDFSRNQKQEVKDSVDSKEKIEQNNISDEVVNKKDSFKENNANRGRKEKVVNEKRIEKYFIKVFGLNEKKEFQKIEFYKGNNKLKTIKGLEKIINGKDAGDTKDDVSIKNHLYWSPNKKYFAIVNVKSFYEWDELQNINIYNKKGNFLWNVKKPKYPITHLSNSGNYYVYIWNSDGLEDYGGSYIVKKNNNEIKLNGHMGNNWNISDIKDSEDGSMSFDLANVNGLTLIKLDKEGRVIKGKSFEYNKNIYDTDSFGIFTENISINDCDNIKQESSSPLLKTCNVDKKYKNFGGVLTLVKKSDDSYIPVLYSAYKKQYNYDHDRFSGDARYDDKSHKRGENFIRIKQHLKRKLLECNGISKRMNYSEYVDELKRRYWRSKSKIKQIDLFDDSKNKIARIKLELKNGNFNIKTDFYDSNGDIIISRHIIYHNLLSDDKEDVLLDSSGRSYYDREASTDIWKSSLNSNVRNEYNTKLYMIDRPRDIYFDDTKEEIVVEYEYPEWAEIKKISSMSCGK